MCMCGGVCVCVCVCVCLCLIVCGPETSTQGRISSSLAVAPQKNNTLVASFLKVRGKTLQCLSQNNTSFDRYLNPGPTP